MKKGWKMASNCGDRTVKSKNLNQLISKYITEISLIFNC